MSIIGTINMHEDLKDKIIGHISQYPGINQSDLFNEIVKKRGYMAIETARKYMKELIDDKKIHCHKRGKFVTYTAKNIRYEDDLDKTLCLHLDEIIKKSEGLKKDIMSYSYNVKNDLLDPLSLIPDHIDKSIDYAQEIFGKDIDYQQTKKLIHKISEKLNEGDIDRSTEISIRKYQKYARDLNNKLFEQKNLLPQIRGNQKRNVINKKIKEIRIKLEPLYDDLYSINEKLDNGEPVGSCVDKMNEKHHPATKNRS